MLELGEVGHAGTLPEGVGVPFSDSHPEQHDAVFSSRRASAAASGGIGACPRVVAVVATL